MSFAKWFVLVPVLMLVAVLLPLSGEPAKNNPDAELYEVRLADDSVVKMRLLTEELEVITQYGTLKVPMADVRRIDVGFRYPEGVQKRVDEAVANLASADFKVREAASAELLRQREYAYPALKRAKMSDDQEVKRRAGEVFHELEDRLPAEKLRLRDQDVVYTTQFPIAGRIKSLALKGRSPVFGEVQVQFTDARQVRSLAVADSVEVVVDAAQWAAPTQNQWFDTKIDVEKGNPLKLRASGLINLNPQNGNNFMTGPDGSNQWGQNGGYPPGTLIGRIGRNGQEFPLRSHYDGEAPQTGRLYMRIAPSPWGQQASGSYTVKAITEIGLGLPGASAEANAPQERPRGNRGDGGGGRARKTIPFAPAPKVLEKKM